MIMYVVSLHYMLCKLHRRSVYFCELVVPLVYNQSYLILPLFSSLLFSRKYFLATFCPTASNNDNETERVGANSLENLETPERQIQDGTEHVSHWIISEICY